MVNNQEKIGEKREENSRYIPVLFAFNKPHLMEFSMDLG